MSHKCFKIVRTGIIEETVRACNKISTLYSVSLYYIKRLRYFNGKSNIFSEKNISKRKLC